MIILDCFKAFPTNSISTWAQLVEPFIIEFNEVGDPFSLLYQLTSIKKKEKEKISNFNIHFKNSWERVPISVRPLDS